MEKVGDRRDRRKNFLDKVTFQFFTLDLFFKRLISVSRTAPTTTTLTTVNISDKYVKNMTWPADILSFDFALVPKRLLSSHLDRE